MSDANEGPKRLAVLAIHQYPDKKDETKTHTRWMKVGVGWRNRDGSINLFMDAFPVGTNRLQIREDDRVPLAPTPRRNGSEAMEVRPNGAVGGASSWRRSSRSARRSPPTESPPSGGATSASSP